MAETNNPDEAADSVSERFPELARLSDSDHPISEIAASLLQDYKDDAKE